MTTNMPSAMLGHTRQTLELLICEGNPYGSSMKKYNELDQVQLLSTFIYIYLLLLCANFWLAFYIHTYTKSYAMSS
jgi:hypothetical protein